MHGMRRHSLRRWQSLCSRRWAVVVLLAVSILWLILAARTSAAPQPGKIDYNFQIRPLLADRCFVCHGPDENKRKAKLRLDIPEVAFARGAVVPGKPEESAVIERITAEDPSERMPPAKSNLHLSKDEIDLIRRWIAEGAEYKTHWAFLPPPERVPLPAVTDAAWPSNPIDHFILARLEQEGLKPSPAASRED